MATKNDNLELNLADLKRRNSTPTIRIGTDTRVQSILCSLKTSAKIKLYQVLPTTLNLGQMHPKPPSTQWDRGEALQGLILLYQTVHIFSCSWNF